MAKKSPTQPDFSDFVLLSIGKHYKDDIQYEVETMDLNHLLLYTFYKENMGFI